MRPEIKQFLLGVLILLAIGYFVSLIITPETFGGWVLTVIGTIAIFALLKQLLGT